MKMKRISEIIKKYEKNLPHFPDGRIDYSNAEEAPTVICFLKYEKEILMLKRSSLVRTHKNNWSTVAGYLDESKPIVEKASQEVEEETKIDRKKIFSITRGGPVKIEEKMKTWISHPILMELKEKPKIELNWEHTDYKWVKIEETKSYLSPPLIKGLKNLISS